MQCNGLQDKFYVGAGKGRGAKASGAKPVHHMAMELFVDRDAFRKRRAAQKMSLPNGPIASQSTQIVRKRSATLTSNFAQPLSKRSAYPDAGGVMQSSFIGTAQKTELGDRPPPPLGSFIKFIKAHATCDTSSGQVEVLWPDNSIVSDGILAKDEFASGATKKVYTLAIGSELYVAKRFFDIGNGNIEITASENADYLHDELVRLKITDWFLSNFFQDAKHRGIEVHSDIRVSEGFLIREVGKPSHASGLTDHDTATWLVEPRRTKSCEKFVGTTVFPALRGHIGKTLVAFLHYVYEKSGEDLVLADLQGSPMNVNSRNTTILFDMMTHSKSGHSGIGDHGPDGIAAFVNQHLCNEICKGLGQHRLTKSLVSHKSDSDEEDPSDSGNEGHGGKDDSDINGGLGEQGHDSM